MKDKALEKLIDIQKFFDKRISDLNQRYQYRTEFHIWCMSDDAFRDLIHMVDDVISEVKEIEEAEELP